MKAFKLTNERGCTRGPTQWGENVTHTAASDEKDYLCSDSWIHFYTSPLVAVLMNPIHANFTNPILWECEVEGKVLEEPLKSGCKQLTTIKQIPLPNLSLTQKIAFGILCAKEVCRDLQWNAWADNWLNGVDRSYAAATAADAAATAAYAYAAAAAAAADAAAAAAAYAAAAAAAAATAADAAATAAAAAAAADATAAAAAAAADATIDFKALAQRTLAYN